MKNKTTAAVLAIFLGWAGIHRFYLGQTGLGILYFCLIFLSFGMVPFVLGLIDGIVLLNMDENQFNRKYNSQNSREQAMNRNMQNYGRDAQQRNTPPLPREMQNSGRELSNPYKVNGIKKYKEFDLEGAIDDFKKGLELSPKDISLHFNIACAYSLTEQVDLAYQHLDKAVSLGFNDFEKLKTHDDLAYVRIQDRWDDFKNNGFRLQAVNPLNTTKTQDAVKEEPIQDDLLLSQLKRLGELRDRGLLSEQEFMIEKKKLSR